MRSEYEDYNDSIWQDSIMERCRAEGKIEACREIDNMLDEFKTTKKFKEAVEERIKETEMSRNGADEGEDIDFYDGKLDTYRDLLDEIITRKENK